jgi:glycosyltransferase involved in cell wall biosynthesis
MKICYLSPTIARPHGGIRVFFEHCNALAARGHEVTLQVMGAAMTRTWGNISPDVTVRFGHAITDEFDVVVAGWPPHANLLNTAKIGAKKFFLCQMAEHLFNPKDRNFATQCAQAYRVPFPIIGISRWVEYLIRTEGRRGDGKMYYIGNGVSNDFKPGKKNKIPTVLVEGWNPMNYAKDVDSLAAKVAKRLKEEHGVTVLGYGQTLPKLLPNVPDEYHEVPTQETLIRLYQQSHILLKASLMDARSCAPVEAIACGCVPVRGIRHGDDDLINGYNALVTEYNEQELYDSAVRLLTQPHLQKQLAANGQEYRKQWLDWNFWAGQLENIFWE